MRFISLSRSNQFTVGHCVERSSEVCTIFSIKHAGTVHHNVTELGRAMGTFVISALRTSVHAVLKSLLSCSTLCDPLDHSPPDSSVHGILLARILEWVACPPPGDLPDPRVEPASLKSPALAGRLFTNSATWGLP